MLTDLVNCRDPDKLVKKSMQEPIFQEMALAALKAVQPQDNDSTWTLPPAIAFSRGQSKKLFF